MITYYIELFHCYFSKVATNHDQFRKTMAYKKYKLKWTLQDLFPHSCSILQLDSVWVINTVGHIWLYIFTEKVQDIKVFFFNKNDCQTD